MLSMERATLFVHSNEFKWQLVKKASQVFYLHFALKKRAFIEEIHEKQEQVRDWLQNLGIGDHAPVVQDDDEPDDETTPLRSEESVKNRDVPSIAALPIIRPALGRQHSMSDRAKVAVQGYLNHFLGNIDIVNSREVCKFLEVSKLSFSPEYGPKLKEDYVMVKHLPKIHSDNDQDRCCLCQWLSCCKDNWQKVYVHSKIMIVDDCTTLVGSANINDRSLLGSRDSEIDVVIEDKELVDSFMGGKPWKAGKFASSLIISLWSEHLGLRAGEVGKICDPVIDSTYKDIWMATAKMNTMIYQDVFSCIPNDLVHSRASLRQCMTYWKEKLGHTTIDIGIAPNKLEPYQDGDIKSTDPIERLESVKGHLVSFPLDFMSKEDLRPVFKDK